VQADASRAIIGGIALGCISLVGLAAVALWRAFAERRDRRAAGKASAMTMATNEMAIEPMVVLPARQLSLQSDDSDRVSQVSEP
jgi:hypothetical protein